MSELSRDALHMTATLRVGRRVGRTIYALIGPEASDDDPLVATADSPVLAERIVRAVNSATPVAEPTDLDPCYGNPVERCTNPGHGRGPTAPTAEEEAIGDLRDHLGLPKHTPPSIVVAEAHMRAVPPMLAEVSPLRPDFVGGSARYHEAVTSGLAQALWLSAADGAVWVTEDGDIAAKSRYSGNYVSEWHGEAIISAHRWREDEMPVTRGETVSGKRAENAPHGTLLVRCDEKGAVLAGQSVICTDGGFTGSSVLLYRVLDLPGGDEA